MRIALDAGHGMETPGKRIPESMGLGTYQERWLNERIVDIVAAMLVDLGHVITRTYGSNDTPLSERAQRANAFSSDIVLSLHHNAGISGGAGGGTCVYVYSEKNVERGKHLYDKITARTHLIGNRSTPVIARSDLYILRHTKAPAYLIENGFMDSTTDAPIIITKDHALLTAKGIVDFINAIEPSKKPADHEVICPNCGTAFSDKSMLDFLTYDIVDKFMAQNVRE